MSLRPMGICDSLYKNDSDAKIMAKLEDCHNPDLNSISNHTLSELIKSGKQNYLIIDCRFEYEYNGGHIFGAINLNSP